MDYAEERWLQQHDKIDQHIELSDPQVNFFGRAEPDFEACMLWTADLVLTGYCEATTDFTQFDVGYLRCVSVDLTRGERATDVLDDLSADLALLCSAFDGADVLDSIQDQFDSPILSVLALEIAEIAPPFRGRDLGPWLVAETIARLAPPLGVLVLGYPSPLGAPSPGTTDKQAVTKLRRHWRKVGFEPLRGAPGLFGQVTDRPQLDRARAKLRAAADQLSFQVKPKAA